MAVVGQRLEPGRGGVGSQLTPLRCPSSPRHSNLSGPPPRRSRRRWRRTSAGLRQRYRPRAAPPSRASRWVPATRRRSACAPSCSVGSRTPSSASRSNAAASFSSWCTVSTVTVGPDPALVLGHRGQFLGARRTPVRPQVEHRRSGRPRPWRRRHSRRRLRIRAMIPCSSSGPGPVPAAGTRRTGRRGPAGLRALRPYRRRGDRGPAQARATRSAMCRLPTASTTPRPARPRRPSPRWSTGSTCSFGEAGQ